MKLFSSTVHGYLDYLTVIFFFLSPTLFSLSPTASMIAYILAGVHLVLTLITEFKLGWLDLVPINIHGIVELVVSLVLIGGPWIINGIFMYADKLFFSIVGAVIFVVWLGTEYAPQEDAIKPEAQVRPKGMEEKEQEVDEGNEDKPGPSTSYPESGEF